MGGAPEEPQRLLIGESGQVVEGAAQHLGGHAVIEGLQPHRAVDREHGLGPLEDRPEGAIVEIENPVRHAVLAGQILDQGSVMVVAAIAGMVLEGQALIGWGITGKGIDQLGNERLHAGIIRSQTHLRIA